jgi:hypothetical protein
MWIWDNWRTPARGSLKWKSLVAMNSVFIVIGFFIMVAGTYGAVVAIDNSFAAGNTSR